MPNAAADVAVEGRIEVDAEAKAVAVAEASGAEEVEAAVPALLAFALASACAARFSSWIRGFVDELQVVDVRIGSASSEGSVPEKAMRSEGVRATSHGGSRFFPGLAVAAKKARISATACAGRPRGRGTPQ